MISSIANALIFIGALILIAAVIRVRTLMAGLSKGAIHYRWQAMRALILLFIAAYLGFALVNWDRPMEVLDLIVPFVFVSGACFVWLTATLAMQTTLDIVRIDLLERENVTDPLTGVFNRRYLDRRLADEVLRARRYGLELSIALVDVDHFKQINDGHGHRRGDQVLVGIAKVIAAQLRSTDVLARFGGDEFLVIFPSTPLAGAGGVAERLRQSVEREASSLSPQSNAAHHLKVSVSIGIAAISDASGEPGALIQVADENLYRAKQLGRNRVVKSEPAAERGDGADETLALAPSGRSGDSAI